MAASTEEEYPWHEPKKPACRGAFIVVEGLDRAGKTTQVKKLSDKLYASGRNVKAIRFPDRTTPIGRMIDSYLQSKTEMDDHAIHLLFCANRWEQANYIKERIAQGYNVVCDRYYYSGVVYSAAKNNPQLGLAWARQCEVGLPRPDIVVFLDLEPGDAERRGGYGEEKYEKMEMQQRVRKLFLSLRNAPDEVQDTCTINAGVSAEEVAQNVWTEVEMTVSGIENEEKRKLREVAAWPEGTIEKLRKHSMELDRTKPLVD